MKSALIVWSGADTGTSANLFKALEKALSQHIKTVTSSNPLIKGNPLAKLLVNVRANIARIPLILRSDCLIVHSYASLSFISIIAARLARKRVYVFNWDVYPTTINGVGASGFFRKLADKIEPMAVKLATHVVIPTSDFLPFVAHSNLAEMSLWPSIEQRPFKGPQGTNVLKVAFAGQIHRTRGLPEAISAISAISRHRVEFHIFSSGQKLTDEETAGLQHSDLIYYDYMPRESLQEKLGEMNFGLISLHPKFDQPGYPSKVFDYIAANLPVLYFGRPLPAFTKVIEDAGVGSVVGRSEADLASEYERIIQDWPQHRDAYISMVSLSEQKLMSVFSIRGLKARRPAGGQPCL